VSDAKSDDVLVMTRNGSALGVIDSLQDPVYVLGIGTDAAHADRLFVCHAQVDAAGNLVDSWLRALLADGTVLAEYRAPPGFTGVEMTAPILSSDGSALYAADSGNNRVWVWDLTQPEHRHLRHSATPAPALRTPRLKPSSNYHSRGYSVETAGSELGKNIERHQRLLKGRQAGMR
jgi:hypothetical protein